MDDLIKVAKLGSPHGLKGYLKLIPIIDPPELLDGFSEFILLSDSKQITLDTEVIKPYKKNSWLFKAKQWKDINDVESLVNSFLYSYKSDLPKLDSNRYYIADIVGCTVVDSSGIEIGEVLDVLQYSSSDIYKIGNQFKHFLLPAVKEFIQSIDIDKKVIKVTLPDGIDEI
jgi:16S rRNA processing protein RimM